MPPTRHPPGFMPDAPEATPPGFVPDTGLFPTALSTPGSPLFGGRGIPMTPEELLQKNMPAGAAPPASAKERLGEYLPGALSMGLSMALRPAKPAAPFVNRLLQGALGRTALAETGNTLGRGLTGQGWTPTGGGSAPQIVGEILFAPIGSALKARAAGQARAMASDKAAFDKAMHEALDKLEQGGHDAEIQRLRTAYNEQVETSKAAYQAQKHQTMLDYQRRVTETEQRHAAMAGAHGEQSAASIMDDWKKMVPSWESLSSDNRGVVDAVLGKGQRLVGESFDKAMQEALTKAKGETVQLPPKAATAFGFEVTDPLASLSPAVRQALERAGRLPPAATGGVSVDAADLIKRMTGQWGAMPEAYRAAANALDAKGIGNAAARAEYKAAQGLIGTVNKAKSIEYVPGVGHVFNPEKQLAGMSSVGNINELRRRGLGDIFEGPMQAIRGGPAPPPDIPKPIVPPFVPPPRPAEPTRPALREPPPGMPSDKELGIRKRNVGHAFAIGGGLGELAGHMLGHPGYGAYVGGGLLGEGLLGGKQFVTRAPLGPKAQMAARLTPATIGEVLRLLLSQPQRPEPPRPGTPIPAPEEGR